MGRGIPGINSMVLAGSLTGNLHVLSQKESSRVVTYKEGAAMAQKLQTLFVECSAKTKVGVQEAFEELVQKVRGRNFDWLCRLYT